jgi:guanine deaminase
VLTPTAPDAVRYIADGVVGIDALGRIASVDPFDGRPVDEDLRPGILLPGFVDAHLHYPQTRIVGAATGPLLDWLARSTFPEEARFADLDHATAVAHRFAASLARSGTTLAFVYGSVHPHAADALLRVLDARGQRAIVGPVLMDEGCPPELQLDADRALPALEALVDAWHGRDGRLEIAAIPRFALSCSMSLMVGAARLAERRGLWVSTHLSENLDECAVARARFGTPDYLRVYEDAGLLHERSLYAHCIHLSAYEWDRFAAAKAVVAHCPDSNAFLGSGDMPTTEVLARLIPLSIGTDLAAGRTFRIPRILSAAYDNALRTGLVLDPRRLLWWGTRGGALALSHPEVGALEPGLDADLICVDVPEWVDTPEGILASVLFDHDAPPPRCTWVRGRVVHRGSADLPGG